MNSIARSASPRRAGADVMSERPNKSRRLLARGYQHGFVTDIESDTVPPGLDEDVVRLISRKKGEPEFLTDWRLKALRHWLHDARAALGAREIQADRLPGASRTTPRRSAKTDGPKSLDEVDPKLLATYEKLGVPLHERARLAGVAVDAVFDSVSVATTFKERLAAAGVVFCPFSEAVQTHPELIEQYLGTRRAVHATTSSRRSIPRCSPTARSSTCRKGVRCPMELSTYFRINAREHRPVRAHADHCRRRQRT